jgi:hypothetical protein
MSSREPTSSHSMSSIATSVHAFSSAGVDLPSSRYSALGDWPLGTSANLILSSCLPLIFVKSERRCLVSLNGSPCDALVES